MEELALRDDLSSTGASESDEDGVGMTSATSNAAQDGPFRRTIVFGWTALIGAAVAYFAAPVIQDVSSTRLYPAVARVELGKRKEGTKVKTRARFWNPTLFPVKIQSISSSCGCTAATAGERTVRPFGWVDVDVELDTSGLEPKFAKAVQVETTPMGSRTAQIEVRGEVF
jgi:hypothetical protein